MNKRTSRKDNMTKKYEIQHFTICDGWINAWTVDGKPEYFESYKQAEKYLKEDVDEWNSQCEKGCEYEYDEYRIMEVKN